MMLTIDLIHAGGERRTVEAVRAQGNRLDIRWGELAGVYRLDLKRNQLMRAPLWRAASLGQAWRVWRCLTYPAKGTQVPMPLAEPGVVIELPSKKVGMR